MRGSGRESKPSSLLWIEEEFCSCSCRCSSASAIGNRGKQKLKLKREKEKKKIIKTNRSVSHFSYLLTEARPARPSGREEASCVGG